MNAVPPFLYHLFSHRSRFFPPARFVLCATLLVALAVPIMSRAQGRTRPVNGSVSPYSVGNFIWFDANNDAQVDNGETGIAGVQVELHDSSNSVVATVTTDTQGYYRFDNVTSGSNYHIFIPASNFTGSGVLKNYTVSSVTHSGHSASDDNWNHGIYTSNPSSAGVATNQFDVPFSPEPTGETVNSPGVSTYSGNGPSGDSFDDLMVDFGFTQAYSIGNYIWFDTNNDGIVDNGETGVPFVQVQLFEGSSNFVGAMNTDSSGYYRFDNLAAGTYYIRIPASNFVGAGTLAGYLSSTGVDSAHASADDSHDHGIDNANPTSGGVSSAQFTVPITPSEPTAETTAGSTYGGHGPQGDSFDDLTIDFGFYSPSAATSTPTSTATQTPTNTPTSTPTSTATQTPTNTPTNTPTSTATPTNTPIPAKIDSIGIYRGGKFYLRLHNSTGVADITVAFTAGTKPYPIVGDWTGAGFDTIGVYDQSNGLFSLRNTNAAGSPDEQFVLGNPNDVPLSGRWLISATHAGGGVFRPSNGLIYLKDALTTGYADHTMVLGIPSDQGLAGDWNGKGFDSPGVYRPSNSFFYLSNQVTNGSVIGDYQLQYGIGGDAPFVGDWIAQGHDGVGLFRQSNGFTYLKNALTTGYADNTFTYGIAGDVPVAGHWQSVYPPIAPAPVLIARTALPQPGSISVPGSNQLGG